MGIKHLRAYLDMAALRHRRAARATPGSPRCPTGTGSEVAAALRDRGLVGAHGRRAVGVQGRPLGGAARGPGRAGAGRAARRPGVGAAPDGRRPRRPAGRGARRDAALAGGGAGVAAGVAARLATPWSTGWSPPLGAGGCAGAGSAAACRPRRCRAPAPVVDVVAPAHLLDDEQPFVPWTPSAAGERGVARPAGEPPGGREGRAGAAGRGGCRGAHPRRSAGPADRGRVRADPGRARAAGRAGGAGARVGPGRRRRLAGAAGPFGVDRVPT